MATGCLKSLHKKPVTGTQAQNINAPPGRHHRLGPEIGEGRCRGRTEPSQPFGFTDQVDAQLKDDQQRQEKISLPTGLGPVKESMSMEVEKPEIHEKEQEKLRQLP